MISGESLDLAHGRERADGNAAIAIFTDAGKPGKSFEVDDIFRQQTLFFHRDH